MRQPAQQHNALGMHQLAFDLVWLDSPNRLRYSIIICRQDPRRDEDHFGA
jgi:hypothetical protein